MQTFPVSLLIHLSASVRPSIRSFLSLLSLRDCPLAFSFRQIHFARFPFLRIDCACVQSNRPTNDHERLSLHFELRSMRTFRSDVSAPAVHVTVSARRETPRFSRWFAVVVGIEKINNRKIYHWTNTLPNKIKGLLAAILESLIRAWMRLRIKGHGPSEGKRVGKRCWLVGQHLTQT